MTFSECYAEAMRLTAVDLNEAARLSRRASRMAQRSGDPREIGLAERLLGHVAVLRSRHRRAIEHYVSSVQSLDRANQFLEAAITKSGAVGALIYLAEFEQLQRWADEARAVFHAGGDRARVARLDGNLALALFRQDRFSEALDLYDRVHRELREVGRPVDVAVALWNRATCLISMGDYAAARRAHREAHAYAEQHHLPLHLAAIDYNVAYLHYLSGDYTEAIQLYDVARRTGEPYRRALCDLDEAEMYLELNLHREAMELAQRAIHAFRRLRMPYEQGKATAFLAIAQGQLGFADKAVRSIGLARRTFRRERNPVWLALLDLYQAILLDREGHLARAQQLAEAARRFFASTAFAAKAATAELLVARLELRMGQWRQSLERCEQVQATLPSLGSASLEYQAAQLRAEALEVMGRHDESRRAYQRAGELLERLRFRLRGDEIKIAFLKDKLSVYDHLFWLTLTDGDCPDRISRAFLVAETAKARSMAEQAKASAASADSAELLEIRRDLDAVYQQVQRAETSAPFAARPELRERARRLETQLAGRQAALHGLAGESASAAGPPRPEEIQRSLPPGTQLLEYFVSRGTIFAFLIDQRRIQVWPLAPLARVQRLVRFVRFQLRGQKPALHAHLGALYDEIVAPLRPHLLCDHLVVVPHGALHAVPFAALHDGRTALVEQFAISYAPSASLWQITSQRPRGRKVASLVVGVADAKAPLIAAEARTVAEVLPSPKIVTDGGATLERLKAEGREARFLHLAAHGFIQRENPLFSSIQLADSWLTVFDLYRCEFPADLITLSGCSTGLSEVVGADEQVGLLRGLLQAGTRNAMVSLWDVDDESTTVFMQDFYRQMLGGGLSPAWALRQASLNLRQRYSDPYHWAAFVMVGAGT